MNTLLLLNVEGMTCSHCTRAVQKTLETVPGITVERVELGRPVEVRLDETRSDRAAVAAAVERAGYPTTLID